MYLNITFFPLLSDLHYTSSDPSDFSCDSLEGARAVGWEPFD